MTPLKSTVEHDIDEFGDIGDLKISFDDVDIADVNLDGMSKDAVRLMKSEETLANAHKREVERVAKMKQQELHLDERPAGHLPLRCILIHFCICWVFH